MKPMVPSMLCEMQSSMHGLRPQVLEQNLTLKLKSPDYINVDPVTARRDFLVRVG